MRARMTTRVVRVLRRGPSTFGQLKRRLGAGARGPHRMVVLPNFIKVGGLSEELGDAIRFLITSGVVRVDAADRLRLEDRRTVRVRDLVSGTKPGQALHGEGLDLA
jgi:hypothetical protein